MRLRCAVLVLLLLVIGSASIWAVPTYRAELLLETYTIGETGQLVDGQIPLGIYESVNIRAAVLDEEGVEVFGKPNSAACSLTNRYLAGWTCEPNDYHSNAMAWSRKTKEEILLSEEYSRVYDMFGSKAVGIVYDETNGFHYYPAIWTVSGKKAKENIIPLQMCYFLDINSRGQILGQGYMDYEAGDWVGFLYQNGDVQRLTPFGTTSWAEAINDNSQIVGSVFSHVNIGLHAAIFDGKEGYTILPDLDTSYALDNNNDGLIVGYTDDQGGDRYGAVWKDGEMYLIDDLMGEQDWYLYQCNSIDEEGRILAQGRDPNWKWGLYLLTPQ